MATTSIRFNLQRDGWAIAFAVLSVVAQGHRFGVGNQELLLPAMRRLLDPTYLSGDWAVSLPAHHPLLTTALAHIAKQLGEAWTLLLAHLLTRIILMTGAWRLCAVLVPRARIAPYLAMLMAVLEPRLAIGGHYLQGGHWEPALLGMALGVWMIAVSVEWLEGRAPWWLLGFVSGIAILCHLFIATPLLAVVSLALLARRSRLVAAGERRSFIGMIAVALIVGAPSWIPAARDFFNPSDRPISNALVILILEIRHPHHHMPWTWPRLDWLMAGAFAVLGLFFLWRFRSPMTVPVMLTAWYTVSGALFFLCTWRLILAAVVYFQAFRLLGLLLMVGACGTAAVAEVLWHWKGKWSALIRLLAIVLVLSFRLPELHLAAVILSAASLRKSRWLDELLPESVSPVGVVRWAWIPAAVSGIAAIAVLQMSPAARQFTKQFHSEHWIATLEEPGDTERRELSAWLRANTSAADVLLVPPTAEGFRVRDNRPIVVDWKLVPYDAAPLWEWARRILILADESDHDKPLRPQSAQRSLMEWREARDPQIQAEQGYAGRSMDELQRIATYFHARWIVRRRSSLAGADEEEAEPVFANSKWSVWKVLEETP